MHTQWRPDRIDRWSDLALHPEDWSSPHLGIPTAVTIEVLVGENSPLWLHATAEQAAVRAEGTLRVLAGQDHGILWQPDALKEPLRCN